MKTFISKIFLGLMITLVLSGCDLKRDSGLWRGTVVVRDEMRNPYTCELEVDISHTDRDLILHHMLTSCKAYSAKWHPGTYEVHGESVWKNGRSVGTALPDGTVSLELNDQVADDRYPMPASRVIVSWMRVGEGLEFTEEAYFAGRIQRSSGLLRRVR